MRGEGIYLQDGSIRRGERVYTYRADQSYERRGYTPTGWTNHTRGEGIYLQGCRRERLKQTKYHVGKSKGEQQQHSRSDHDLA
eukprot:2421342-Pyramimonas_sp.AAC.1